MKNNSNQKAKVKSPRQKTNKKQWYSFTNSLPPPLSTVAVTSFRRRFKQSGTLAGNGFTLSDGINQFMMQINSTTSEPIVDMWRIKAINLYLTGDQKEVSFTSTANDTADNFINSRELNVQLSSMNDAQARHVKIVPRDSYDPIFSWHHASPLNASANLFLLTSNSTSGLEMDITFEAILNFIGNSLGYSWSTTAPTGVLGAVSVCSGKLFPQGVNQLA
jgi:hypothetical protein